VAGWLFPRYAANEAIRATHASNTINKRLKVSLGIPKTSHSFRHAMRDRLRETGVPEDTKDAIGGWSSGRSIGRGYGEGYSLGRLKEALDKVATQ